MRKRKGKQNDEGEAEEFQGERWSERVSLKVKRGEERGDIAGESGD